MCLHCLSQPSLVDRQRPSSPATVKFPPPLFQTIVISFFPVHQRRTWPLTILLKSSASARARPYRYLRFLLDYFLLCLSQFWTLVRPSQISAYLSSSSIVRPLTKIGDHVPE